MFTNAILAQAAPGGGDVFMQLVPFILIFAIMYFLILRPQQKKMKDHKAMIEGLKRGDAVTISGGIMGKITRVDDTTVDVEIAKGTEVKVIRQAVVEVRSKTEPTA